VRRDSLHGKQHISARTVIRACFAFSYPVFIHRNMSKPLSPAAQAVMDAAACVPIPDQQAFGILRLEIAAALRAASDRTECLIGDTSHPKFAEGVLAAGDLLERIAAELEGPNA
jgi:hypothetical protein